MSRTGAPRHALVAVCLIAAASAACGKRGDPLPPLRPTPARVDDLAIRRTADSIAVALTVPAANVDGTSPAAVDRVDVFAATLPAGSPAPTAAQLASDSGNLAARIIVRETAASPQAGAPASPPAATPRPTASALPGELVRVVDAVSPGTDAGAAIRYYTAVPIAGTGSGRPGPASSVLPVPLGSLPAPPVSVSLTHDEADLVLSWQPAAVDQRFRVYRTGVAFDPATADLLTPEPTTDTEYRTPVAFGRETCFSVVPIAGTAPVSIEGTPSPVQCITPTDTYPPPVPSGLEAVAGNDAVTLVWTAVPAGDLAGYVVLRSAAGGGEPQPLFDTPITATSYRDTTVQPGETYTYTVYAVDAAPAPNRSAPSAPQVVTIR